MDLSALPDYPALQQLARALWRNGSVRGAAALVGAGLSKNANRPGRDTPSPPLWGELLAEMTTQLYPNDRTAAPTNPLRLAEEYRTYFGQAALDDFIRARFPDRAWQPSALHVDLLNLPWADVLTTNWDTLIERAAELSDDYVYELVRFETDLPHARAPRIVKLHGTIGDNASLIFTEEDYRTYPAEHAAYVNLARQIFIENDLCLLGFSGDDPNYLQWAGWVRDQLKGAARRVYLVGCLNLPEATRKYLESQNISPIDLASAVAKQPKEAQHGAALQLFFHAMRDAKPNSVHEWSLVPASKLPMNATESDMYERVRKDDDFAATVLRETIKLIRTDRQTYPGWLLCPRKFRHDLSHTVQEAWLLRPAVLAHFEMRDRGEVLDELLWRQGTALQQISTALRLALVAFMEDPQSHTHPSMRRTFSLALIRNARYACNGAEFEKWAQIADGETELGSPERTNAQYQRCLRDRDLLDFEALETSLGKLEDKDPVWKLRRAALHCEIGDETLATRLIEEATAELERLLRLDRSSLWIKSRLGWANWISRLATNFTSRRSQGMVRPREFRNLLIDPDDEMECLRSAANSKLVEQRDEEAELTPLFELGAYRPRQGRVKALTAPLDWGDRHELDSLMETVGIPLSINHMGICSGTALAVAQIGVDRSFEWYAWLLRAVHSHLDSQFLRYFSRLGVAQIPLDVCQKLIACTKRAIPFWADRLKRAASNHLNDDQSCAISQLRLAIMIQSRLTVRMTEDQAEETYRLALTCATDPNFKHHWIAEALGELMGYAAKSLSPTRQGHLAFSAIDFPLAAEVRIEDRVWPDPVGPIWRATPNRPANDPRWAHRIQQLIDATAGDGALRKEAITRLAYLSLRGALNANESQAFANNLWAKLDTLHGTDGLPKGSNLLLVAFAELPTPPGVDAPARIRHRLRSLDMKSPGPESLNDDSRLMEQRVAIVESLRFAHQAGLKLSPARCDALFDKLTAWTRVPPRQDSFTVAYLNQYWDRLFTLNGEILANIVVPAMRVPSRTAARGRILLHFIEQASVWVALIALPHFLSITALRTEIEATIRRNLVSPDYQRAGSAALALVTWARLAKRKLAPDLTRSALDPLITAIESGQERGLSMRLSAARQLIGYGIIDNRGRQRLIDALRTLAETTDYDRIPLDSHEAVTVSLIRRECVRLANALILQAPANEVLKAWLRSAANDPLPEVRFSLLESESEE